MQGDLVGITLISAVASASVLLIATLGLAVVFGLMGVTNLAHGEFIMLGAFSVAVDPGGPSLLGRDCRRRNSHCGVRGCG